jgi:tetratricopeptide (TPR) repeat protein
VNEAENAIEQLDKISSGDFRTLAAVGVLLARYHLYDDAIQHFQTALQVNPQSDEENFDLADAFFHRARYSDALDAAYRVSEAGRKDDSYLELLGDIYAHLGDIPRAEGILRDTVSRNPDNDQEYLALGLLELRENNVASAKRTLLKGLARVPASGRILWGLGICSVLEGDTPRAAEQFERALELLPEWPGSYSILGVFYFQTGQIAKAKDVLNRFKGNSSGGMDVTRIEQALAKAQVAPPGENQTWSAADRQSFLQLALSMADKTL